MIVKRLIVGVSIIVVLVSSGLLASGNSSVIPSEPSQADCMVSGDQDCLDEVPFGDHGNPDELNCSECQGDAECTTDELEHCYINPSDPWDCSGGITELNQESCHD